MNMTFEFSALRQLAKTYPGLQPGNCSEVVKERSVHFNFSCLWEETGPLETSASSFDAVCSIVPHAQKVQFPIVIHPRPFIPVWPLRPGILLPSSWNLKIPQGKSNHIWVELTYTHMSTWFVLSKQFATDFLHELWSRSGSPNRIFNLTRGHFFWKRGAWGGWQCQDVGAPRLEMGDHANHRPPVCACKSILSDSQ